MNKLNRNNIRNIVKSTLINEGIFEDLFEKGNDSGEPKDKDKKKKKSGKGSEKGKSHRRKEVMNWLGAGNDEHGTFSINHAEAMRRLYNPANDDEEDAKRSLFSKKFRHAKNDNGSTYEFSDDEITKLFHIMTDVLTENKVNKIIKNSTKKALNEISWQAADDASTKIEDEGVNDILQTLQYNLKEIRSCFGDLSQITPNRAYQEFDKYIQNMQNFVDRKLDQVDNIQGLSQDKFAEQHNGMNQRQYDDYITQKYYDIEDRFTDDDTFVDDSDEWTDDEKEYMDKKW